MLPEVLLVEDIARFFGLKSLSAARRAIVAGRYGPYSRSGRRLVLRRESVLAHLADHEEDPSVRRGPRAIPRPSPEALALLAPRPRRRKGKEGGR